MRFRPATALFLAYALTLSSVLGAVSSASLAGTSHIQICVTSAQDGKPLPPAHSHDLDLCCFVAQGGQQAASLPSESTPAQPALFSGKKILPLAFSEIAGTGVSSANPRAPPARA